MRKVTSSFSGHSKQNDLIGKPKSKPVFGDLRWDYIKTCSHNLNSAISCPMCKLIERATSSYFDDEYKKKSKARIDGFKKRAKMRYELLEIWARSQASLYGQGSSLSGNFYEISFTNDTVDALNKLPEGFFEKSQDLSETIRLLQKRKRILEVGLYAAILLQRVIRGYCCRRKLRKLMLARFECVYNRLGLSYYYDTVLGIKLRTAPYLLKYERPGSPKTIKRRLLTDDKKQKLRERYFTESQKRMKISMDKNINIWNDESEKITRLRQIAIFRDVISLAMYFIALKRREEKDILDAKDLELMTLKNNEQQTNLLVSSPKVLSRIRNRPLPRTTSGSVDIASNTKLDGKKAPVLGGINHQNSIGSVGNSKMLDLLETSSIDSGTNTPTKRLSLTEPITNSAGNENAVWIATSSPLPSVRQISLSLALKTTPFEIIASQNTVSSSTPTTPQNRTNKKVESESDSTKSVNNRLMMLEEKAWECLRCNRPEDVLRILASDELQPALASALQIGSDEYSIWMGSLQQQSEEEVKLPTDIMIEDTPTLLTSTMNTYESYLKYTTMEQNNHNNSNNNANSTNNSIIFGDKLVESDKDIPPAATTVTSATTTTTTTTTTTSSFLLPIHIQLHPYYEQRKSFGIFRLFFLDGELIAATQYSPWVYYKKISSLKDVLAAAIIEFGESSSAYINQLMEWANRNLREDQEPPKFVAPLTSAALHQKNNLEAMNSQKGTSLNFINNSNNINGKILEPKSPGSALSTFKMNNILFDSLNQNAIAGCGDCIPLFVPPENALFGGLPIFKPALLDDQETVNISQNYKFLNSLSLWRNKLRKSRMKLSRRTGGATKTSSNKTLEKDQEQVITQDSDNIETAAVKVDKEDSNIENNVSEVKPSLDTTEMDSFIPPTSSSLSLETNKRPDSQSRMKISPLTLSTPRNTLTTTTASPSSLMALSGRDKPRYLSQGGGIAGGDRVAGESTAASKLPPPTLDLFGIEVHRLSCLDIPGSTLREMKIENIDVSSVGIKKIVASAGASANVSATVTVAPPVTKDLAMSSWLPEYQSSSDNTAATAATTIPSKNEKDKAANKISASTTTTTTTSSNNKGKFALNVSSIPPYEPLLQTLATGTHTAIPPRINPPSKVIAIDPLRIFDLVVLDVYFDFIHYDPKKKKNSKREESKVSSTATATTTTSSTVRSTIVGSTSSTSNINEPVGIKSSLSGINRLSAISNTNTLPHENKYKDHNKDDSKSGFSPVIHHLVGVYSTKSTRPPPNVDFGLFTWAFFTSNGSFRDYFDSPSIPSAVDVDSELKSLDMFERSLDITDDTPSSYDGGSTIASYTTKATNASTGNVIGKGGLLDLSARERMSEGVEEDEDDNDEGVGGFDEQSDTIATNSLGGASPTSVGPIRRINSVRSGRSLANTNDDNSSEGTESFFSETLAFRRQGTHQSRGSMLSQSTNKSKTSNNTSIELGGSSLGGSSSSSLWSTPNPASGIKVFKQEMPSGREFEFRLLGAVPTRAYLEGKLPPKVKAWIGMP